MQEKKWISLHLKIHPRYFNNISLYIQQYVFDHIHNCIPGQGYILQVLDILRKGSMKIHHTTGYGLVSLKVHVDILMPHIGDVLYACISKIYPEGGIFLAHGPLKILVPITEQEGMKVYPNLIETRDGEQYNVGSWANVKLTAVQYKMGQYQCIGTFENVLKEYEINTND